MVVVGLGLWISVGNAIVMDVADAFVERNVFCRHRGHHGGHHVRSHWDYRGTLRFGVEVLEPMPPGVVRHVDVVDVLRRGLHGVRLPQALLEMRLTPR